MRLRLTVERNAYPPMNVVWNIDGGTISDLLYKVNEIIPIESSHWGYEDYTVELRGSNGVNFECLHFQEISKVFKDEDEVSIRPLLTHDMRIRRISGRHQISEDGRRIYDGIPYGRPLLMPPSGRPEIYIPPRKRARIIEAADEEGDEPLAAIEEQQEGAPENPQQQMILHTGFEDEESEDDDDFAPEDEDMDDESSEDYEVSESSGSSEKSVDEIEFEEFADEKDSGAVEDKLATEVPKAILQSNKPISDEEVRTFKEGVEHSAPHFAIPQDDDEVLADILDEVDRLKLRKLRTAFPQASMTVCKHVFHGAHRDMEVSWAALMLGFEPVLPKNTVIEALQAPSNRSTPKKRQKLREHSASPAILSSSKKRSAATMEENDNDLSEPNENERYQRWNTEGLPPGSIGSGNALKVMAELASSSPSRGRTSASREPISSWNNKVKFVEEEAFSQSLTSTPFIDKDFPQEDSSDADSSDDSSDVSSDSSSEDSSEDTDENSKDRSVEASRRVPAPRRDDSESSSSSEDDSDESDQSETMDASRLSIKEAKTPTSGSDSDSSSSDSSDDDIPEEISSKDITNNQELDGASRSRNEISQKTVTKQATVAPSKGKTSTQKRNERRKISNAVERYVKKGLLPAGTTSGELTKLDPAERKRLASASAALDAGNSPKFPIKSQEFELQRQKLLESIADGGVEIGESSPKSPRRTEPIQHSATQGSAQEPAKEIPDTIQASFSPAVDPDVGKGTENSQILDASMVLENSLHPLQKSPQDFQMKDSSLHELPFPTQRTEVDAEEPLIILQPTNVNGEGNGEVSLARVQAVVSNTEQPRPSTGPDSIVDTSEAVSIAPASADSSQAKTDQRRSKFDTSAGKRLLFGALGIKAPANEKEANEARSKLMKGIRLTKELPKNTKSSSEPSELQVEPEYLTAWESVINYRAVECCYPGMPLSKPPFPFVQRWDPQQQRGNKRKNGHQRNASQYYEDTNSASNPKRRKGTHNYESEAPDSLQYDDPVEPASAQNGEVENEVDQQLQHENQTAQSEESQAPYDLVALPEDPSTLPDLPDGAAQARMIIAFKQLEMSEATMWQPQMSPYKTAIVIDVLDDGSLDMLLAQRDRAQSEKIYDYDTGERIYGKFEMPVDEDDNDDEDGRLCLTFAELVQPKIVVGLPINADQNAEINETSQPKDQPSTDKISTSSLGVISHEKPMEAQFSHLTEIVLDLDVQEPQSPEVDNTNDIEAINSESPDPKLQNQNDVDLEIFGASDKQPHAEVSLDAVVDGIQKIVDSFPDAQLDIADLSVAALNGPLEVQDEAEAEIIAEKEEKSRMSVILEVAEASMIGEEAFSTTENISETIAKNVPGPGTGNIIGTEEEAECHRKEFSEHIKELGFRSTIPSSTMRDLHPNDMETSAAVVFIQTEQDMAEIEQSSSYSPIFNGFGTSPSMAEIDIDSPSSVGRQPSRSPRVSLGLTSKSPLPPKRQPSKSLQPSPILPSNSPSLVDRQQSKSPEPSLELPPKSSSPVADRLPLGIPPSSLRLPTESPSNQLSKEPAQSPKVAPEPNPRSSEPLQSSWQIVDDGNEDEDEMGAAESDVDPSDDEQNDIVLYLDTKDRDLERSARPSPMNIEEKSDGELSKLLEPNPSSQQALVSRASTDPDMKPTELRESSQKLSTSSVLRASDSKNSEPRSVSRAPVINFELRATRSRSASRAIASGAPELREVKSKSPSREFASRASESGRSNSRSISRAAVMRTSEPRAARTRSLSKSSMSRASEQKESKSKSASKLPETRASEHGDLKIKSVSRVSPSRVPEPTATKLRPVSVSKATNQIPSKSISAPQGSTSRASPTPDAPEKVSETASPVKATKSPSAQAQESKITAAIKRRSIELIRPPPLSKAVEGWKSFDTKTPKSDDVSGSKSPTIGVSLDDIDEREPSSIEYPKLSVNSSFTSQVTDHGRQPDFNFDESVATNVDTSMLPSLPNADANGGTVSEPDLPRVAQKIGLSKNVHEKNKVSKPPKEPTRRVTPLPEDGGSDSDFPDIKDICSQPLPKREKITPVRRSKALIQGRLKSPIEANMSDDTDHPPKKNSRQRKSLFSVGKRKANNEGEKLKSQPQQPVPSSQHASQFIASSKIIDIISSNEDESESSVPKVPSPKKKFRDIGEVDNNQYTKGRASKSPKRAPKARRGSTVRLKDPSQASNKGRMQTYGK